MVVYRLYTIVYRAWPGGSGENSPIWGGGQALLPIYVFTIYYLFFCYFIFSLTVWKKA